MENSTLSRIYTSSKNIEGIMNNLSVIMDKKGYIELDTKYQNIIKLVPKDTILSNEEKKYGYFGVDVKYYSLDSELRDFEKELSQYNVYKQVYDKMNEIIRKQKLIFKDSDSLNEYVRLNCELVMLIDSASNLKYIQQFTGLMNDAFNTLFDSLKILCSFDDKRLLDYINKVNDEYITEHLSSLIRKGTNTTINKGDLDRDYVDYETIVKCSLNDSKIVNYLNDAEEYIKRTKIEEEKRIEEEEKKKEQLELIKRRKKILKLKLILLKSLIIPSIVIPLSFPISGYVIGKKRANEEYLTKTITSTIDMTNNKLQSSSEEYRVHSTSYVASVTICGKYKKNISGSSYTRTCNVYDYNTEGLSEDFKLTKDNIDEKRLVLKYTYEETNTEIDTKYINEEQILVTETYQDKNDTKSNKKYTIGATEIGAAIGIGTSLGGYFLYNECLSYYFDDKEREIKRELKKLE